MKVMVYFLENFLAPTLRIFAVMTLSGALIGGVIGQAHIFYWLIRNTSGAVSYLIFCFVILLNLVVLAGLRKK